jgi:hypothetical protein
MLSAILEKCKWLVIVSLMAFSTFFLACRDASGPVAATVEDPSGKAPGASGLSQVKGSAGGECEGFDILRTPLMMGVEAMPCAQTCPNTHEPVCTAEGLTYPNACFAELAKAAIVSQGECQ